MLVICSSSCSELQRALSGYMSSRSDILISSIRELKV